MGRAPGLLLIVLVLTASCTETERSPESSSPSPSPVPPASPTAPSPVGPDLAPVRIRLQEVATLEQPLALAVRPDDPTLYVAQKTGQVVALRDRRPQVVLDLSGEVSQGGEQGLLGLAFSPDGGYLYTNHTDVQGDTRVTEFAMDGDRIDPSTRREVLSVDQPFSNHNGGNLAFGPDGYLYIGLGDGGSGGDPMDNAQSLQTLLGKMLRIDPRPGGSRPYAIPPDNPFAVREGARPEIWAYGLRNPWRYSFDRETGDLWIGDVGQSAREEIDLQPAGSPGGENYGWDGFEGTLEYEAPFPEGAVSPVYDYPRSEGATVIGGYVYRGSAIPALQGAYLFSDFFDPRIRALVVDQGRVVQQEALGIEVPNLASFGEDQQGELYALSLSGPVYRLS